MSSNPEFLYKPDFKIRVVSILGAFTCILGGILLFLSTGASLFLWTFINTGPGSLLAGAYGMFAFIIPVYLFWAAWILIDPVFRPGRIFLLSSTIIPFLTLALGFSFIRDFETLRREFDFLGLLGRSGLSIAVITAAILECLGLLIFHSLFFGRHENPVPPQIEPPSAEPVHVNPAHAESPQVEPVIKKTANPEKALILPEWKPPESPAVFRKLEEEKTRESAEEPPRPAAGGTANPAGQIPEPLNVPVKDKVLVLDAGVFSPYTQTGKISRKAPWLIQEALDEIEHLEPHFAGTEKEGPETGAAEDAPEYGAGIVADTEDAADTFADKIQEDDLAAGDFLETDPFDTDTVDELSALEPSAVIEDFPPAELKPAAVPGMVKKNHKKQKGTYVVPVEGILNQYPDGQYWIVDEETKRSARILQDTLSEFGIQAEVTGIRKGPVITMFEILPAPGVKLSKIVNLQDNIALRLAASSVRIVAPIPGKHAVGIEVPNKKRNIVSFREIVEGELSHKREHHKSEVPVVLGKGITGEAVTVDLTQMPHLLIAGATGSGKSVCVNTLILSILYQLAPAKCRLILIDPKIVELKLYNDIPHLLTPVITEPKRAFQALQYCIYEMERRYACLDSMGVRDIKSYNKRIKERNIAAEHMPYIVVVIDEFADLMATTGKELESTVARLAAMSRAVGIHLVLATQRPSIDVITGLIKANIPSRIAFMVASKMDSRIIIDMVGAEKLLGKGDMLYAGAVDPFPIRMQGAFISEEEVERVVAYVKTLGEPEYIDDEIFYDEEEEDSNASLFSEGNDPLYEKALEVVFQQGKASASYIQRRLKIGYNRAARLVEEMEHRGVVGPAQGSKPRELLRGA
ncbi:MAG: DNA translocase FtsK [Spirochaetaceae bacterium]|nr:DNA translocase FtsK [Spirochaetaceae bacterium]